VVERGRNKPTGKIRSNAYHVGWGALICFARDTHPDEKIRREADLVLGNVAGTTTGHICPEDISVRSPEDTSVQNQKTHPSSWPEDTSVRLTSGSELTAVSLEGFSGEPRIEITDSGRVEAARIELKFWADNKQGHEAQLSRCGDNPEKKAEIQGNIAKAEAKIAAALAILDEERSA
jgi:hypothetical protein